MTACGNNRRGIDRRGDEAVRAAIAGDGGWLNSRRESDVWICAAMWDAHDLGYLLAKQDRINGRGSFPNAALVRAKVRFQTEPGPLADKRLRSLRAAYLRAYRERFRLQDRIDRINGAA